MEDLHHPRHFAAMVSHGGRLYIIGGRSGGGEAVEVYSPDTGTWTLVDTHMRISGRVCSAGVIKMYALYGS